jgi:hypothetical protein
MVFEKMKLMDAGIILLTISVVGTVIYRLNKKTKKALEEIESSY